ncbi:hypothetical protein [Burkholderia vietnamiensis]|uniref:hypothetical protein n=1 Tax=Burkholderia vietnamiensis TaxID=60552 RepID=UPI0012D9DABB|nr:hypothetical protein [Burkholderia vietnamiensis]
MTESSTRLTGDAGMRDAPGGRPIQLRPNVMNDTFQQGCDHSIGIFPSKTRGFTVLSARNPRVRSENV